MNRETFTEDYEFEVYKTLQGGYSVSLPHQCDGWEIIGACVEENNQEIPHDNHYPAHPFSKELAVKQMELFVKRANEALEKLRQLD